jgi:cell wall-associated NlpC family hydrolase
MALTFTILAVLPTTATTHAVQLTDGPQADTYTVQPGDTLNAIARRAGVTVDALTRANPQVDPDTLYVGTVLRMPAIANAQPAADISPRAAQPAQDPFSLNPPAPARAALPSSSPTIGRSLMVYSVQAGDTLNSIALRYATTPSTLIDVNGPAVAMQLQAGQSLMVPGTPSMPAAMSAMSGMPAANGMSVASGVPAANGTSWTSGMAMQSAPAAAGSATMSSARADAPTARIATGAPVAPGLSNATTMSSTVPGNTMPSVQPRGMEMTSASLSSTSPAAQIALQYIGSAYVFGGNGPSGFDCSGFVEYVMRQIGRNVPRDLAGQYAAGYHPQGAPEPGDLVFFQDTYDYGLSHVGIYIGNGNFIHAISEASGVGISNMNEPYYVERLYGVTRLPDSVK